MGMSMLVPLNDDGTGTGVFRICLFGGSTFTISISAADLLPDLPASLRKTHLYFSATALQATPLTNATASPWRDLEEMVREGTILTTTKSDEMTDNAELLLFLSATGPGNSPRGAALRWAIAISHEGFPQLELQGLPCQAKFLNKAQFNGDNSVSILLGTYLLSAEMFDAPDIKGPIPLFFAADVEKARAAVILNLGQTLTAVRRVNSRLLHMEHLPHLTAAVAYLEGKHRPARGTPAFCGPVAPPPPLKRSAVAETGSSNIVHFFNSYTF